MTHIYKGHELTDREADQLENKLYYDFAFDRERDIRDFYFMLDRGYEAGSLIRMATPVGMPPKVQWPVRLNT